MAPLSALPPSSPPLLLRVPVTVGRWAEQLPPPPAGAAVTVAFSSEDMAAEHADALEVLGYRVVGVRDAPAGEPPSVDFVVSRETLDRWPVWREALVAGGARVWDLAHGPAAARFWADLAPHR